MSLKNGEMSKCTNHVLSKDVCHANQILPWIARRRGMSYKWGCINIYLRNPIYSTHSLACKTLSHPMAWWIYQQVDLWCPHSQWKCPLFVGDLLWNGGGHQCALFLHVEPDYWLTWLHYHLSHSNGTFLNLITKSLKVAFIQSICAQQLPVDIYLASAVDNATLFCFFDNHETSELPNN